MIKKNMIYILLTAVARFRKAKKMDIGPLQIMQQAVVR